MNGENKLRNSSKFEVVDSLELSRDQTFIIVMLG